MGPGIANVNQPHFLNGWKEIANYLGKGVRTAQRDRHIGLLQRDCVVDAVADKTDLAAFTLQFLDVVGLVGG